MVETMIHKKAYHSWWDGHIVALCGAVAQAGEWEHAWIVWWGEPVCQECVRLAEHGGA